MRRSSNARFNDAPAAITQDFLALQTAVSGIIPHAQLRVQSLPEAQNVELILIEHSYPQHALDSVAIERIMNNPLYWVFCWASGRLLAAHLLSNPSLVAEQRVLDFGAGSGVVAIAAALAGASHVTVCDIDPLALAACRVNAWLNGIELHCSSDFDTLAPTYDLVTVADVLYDRDNMPWLARFREKAPRVLLADSRVRDFNVPPYTRVRQCASATLPDLDEAAAFRTVTLYQTESQNA